MDDDILLVADDPVAIQTMGRVLATMGNLRFAATDQDALRLACERTPDLVLLDAEMPGMGGVELFRAFKAEADLTDVPVIFVTSRREAAFELACFDMGAADFIAKPISAPLAQARVKTQLRMKRMADALHRIATVDSLTGIANRRQFDQTLEREWLLARRAGEPIALLMIDIDHFKSYNDHYGQPLGDVCLQQLADALAATGLRPADLLARSAGGQFVLLLPQTPRSGAEHVGQCVLDAVAALGIAHADSPTGPHVTVSIGIAFDDDVSARRLYPASASVVEGGDLHRPASALVLAADKALHGAKRAGRAQVRVQGIE